MKEIVGDIFSLYTFDEVNPDVICITTNGIVKENGRAVMGAGVARNALENYYNIDLSLGRRIKENGNIVNFIEIIHVNTSFYRQISLYSFPTKHHWKDKSDMNLIEESCSRLREIVDSHFFERIIVPRPGCQNGKLNWEDVKPILEKYFDDRFYIIRRHR